MNEVLCGSLAERRRLEIIEAAERCVMKTGLHRLTLRDIAREQGGSLGNIYNYFANKEEIVEAIVERETDRFIAIAVQGGKAQGEGTLGERLREHIRAGGDKTLLDLSDEDFDKAMGFVRPDPIDNVLMPTFGGLLMIGKPEALQRGQSRAGARHEAGGLGRKLRARHGRHLV